MQEKFGNYQSKLKRSTVTADMKGHSSECEENSSKKWVLPFWPMTVAFAGYPIWWLLGLGDLGWPIVAVAMVGLMSKLGKSPVVPKGFGIWLLFLLWSLCSTIMLDSVGRVAGFFFRYSMYLGATVFFIYVYNAKTKLTEKRVFGALTALWFIVVLGGFAGLLFPVFELRTVLTYILPNGLLSNELIHEMAFRSLTQFNPDPNAYVISAPRPSAPFLYANSWGNVYSVLLPTVIAYASMIRGSKLFWWLVVCIPLSFIPAFLTLNRGMFLGLGVALVYVALRAILAGNVKVLVSMVGLTLVGVIAVTSLPVLERLDERTSRVSSVETRENLYIEAFERTLESPILGYGAPRPSVNPGAPSVGTQGQFWMVLFSHGFPGAALFVGWLVWLYIKTCRRTDVVGIVSNTVVLVTIVEIFYYGILTTGFVVIMVLSALALREKSQGDEDSAVIQT